MAHKSKRRTSRQVVARTPQPPPGFFLQDFAAQIARLTPQPVTTTIIREVLGPERVVYKEGPTVYLPATTATFQTVAAPAATKLPERRPPAAPITNTASYGSKSYGEVRRSYERGEVNYAEARAAQNREFERLMRERDRGDRDEPYEKTRERYSRGEISYVEARDAQEREFERKMREAGYL
jgi:hypothetical protein